MLLSVHILAGSALALTVQNPILSAPLCFATHLVLDSFPHWNYPIPKRRNLISFYKSFGPDLVMTICLEIFLLLIFKRYWYLVIWGSFWSALPDYLTLYKKKKPYKTLLRAYFNFHDKVQFEVGKASGIAVQSLTVVILLMILLAKLGVS